MGLFGFVSLPWDVLLAKYSGFRTPVMRITVNDSLLSLVLSLLGISGSTGIRTDGVSVTLNKDSASSATFRMLDCYDATLRQFTNTGVSIGSKICIQLGYGSVYNTVFTGYVDSMSYEFGEHPSIKVTAFDGVKLMMSGGEQDQRWPSGSFYIQTITEILSRYADICTFLPTNIMPTLKTHGELVQKTNDYDFIKNTLCMYCGRDFVVAGGDGYLIDPMSSAAKVTTLSWGEGLLNFSVNPSYKKVKAYVTGDRIRDIHADSVVKTGSLYKTSLDKEQTIIMENVPLTSTSDCKDYATRLAFEEVRKAQSASGSCIGLPELIPGRSIGISGLDSQWNGKSYLLSSVTHSFRSSGYTTTFQIQGWNG